MDDVLTREDVDGALLELSAKYAVPEYVLRERAESLASFDSSSVTGLADGIVALVGELEDGRLPGEAALTETEAALESGEIALRVFESAPKLWQQRGLDPLRSRPSPRPSLVPPRPPRRSEPNDYERREIGRLARIDVSGPVRPAPITAAAPAERARAYAGMTRAEVDAAILAPTAARARSMR